MADYVKLRTNVTVHVRFLEAGAVARDLYVWAMSWSGWQETDGEIPMAAVMASPWGAGGKRNVVVAQKLVDVGLWERTDKGYRILKWSEQGNVTRAQLEEKRTSARERMRLKRSANTNTEPAPVRANITRTSPEVRTSTSTSTSLSGSSQGGAGGDPPAWWDGAIAAAAAAVAGGTVSDPVARWAEYDASRERKGWARNHRDAVGYLTASMRGERTREAQRPPPRADNRQPLRDPNPEWLQRAMTGTDGGDS